MTKPTFARSYLDESVKALSQLELEQIESVKRELLELKRRDGRLFMIGSGGGAGHASHAVNDFRKLDGIEAYCPSDNVSELTARVNDEGWETSYSGWLRTSRFCARDLLMVFSVGGGDLARNVSPNLVRCLELAKFVGARICGIVGRDGGATAQLADACVIIPNVNPALATPHTEALQAVVWHLLVSDPDLQVNSAKWESISGV